MEANVTQLRPTQGGVEPRAQQDAVIHRRAAVVREHEVIAVRENRFNARLKQSLDARGRDLEERNAAFKKSFCLGNRANVRTLPGVP